MQYCQDHEFTRILAQVSEFGGPTKVTRLTDQDRSESERGATSGSVDHRIDKGC